MSSTPPAPVADGFIPDMALTALAAADRLPDLSPLEAFSVYQLAVVLPDGRRTVLGDCTGSDLAACRRALAELGCAP